MLIRIFFVLMTFLYDLEKHPKLSCQDFVTWFDSDANMAQKVSLCTKCAPCESAYILCKRLLCMILRNTKKFRIKTLLHGLIVMQIWREKIVNVPIVLHLKVHIF